MGRFCGKLCYLSAALAVSGCFSAETVRMPDLLQGRLPSQHAATQRRDFEKHDPLPSEDIGPFTDTRPRSFRIQRALPRRAVENMPYNSLLPSGSAPRTTSPIVEFPNTVNPN